MADRLSYARRYVHCLVGNNLSELQTLSEDKRCHVLRALSCLAKFAGVYDDFRALESAYGLKWTGRSSDDLLIDRLTRVTDPDEMFSWIRQVKTAFPLFAAHTHKFRGRATVACDATAANTTHYAETSKDLKWDDEARRFFHKFYS